ncbi:hypothetical protein OVY29_21935 [Sphingopyxis sp. SE2]|uniref:hypothetical protein n=1 Tax=Sphingopyxis sp. SE2 TaxID=1586240 RepID=UPI0028C318A0|nr:hypothetical protein [Sphingopyxis sp. SE2]MDT7531322.1 hypothetical protein [Sphingopyxis sp. SE2]
MKRTSFGLAAAFVFAASAPSAVFGQALPSQPGTIPIPSKSPAIDPYAPRAQVRVATIAANDNMLRGLGKSAGALGDDLRLIVSAEEASARQARYIRGVSAALAGGGIAASNSYLSRLGRIGKRFKPLGALLTILSLGGVAYDLLKTSDSDTGHSYQHNSATVDAPSSSYSGQKVWSDRFIDGAKYGPGPSTSAMPGVAFPVGRVFIVPAPASGQNFIDGFAYYLVVPVDQSTPVGQANGNVTWVSVYPDGKKYRGYYAPHLASFGDGRYNSGVAKWEQSPGEPGWYIYRAPTDDARLDPNTLSPVFAATATAASSSSPVPPEFLDAPVTASAIMPLVEAGLEAAGLSASESQKQQLAATAAVEMKGRDLNEAPDVNVFVTPAASPLGSYVPQSAHDAASQPSTPSVPGSNPGSPETPGGGSTKVDQDFQVEDPGDMPALPTIDIGSFTYNPGTCPNPSMDFRLSNPAANSIREKMGLPDVATFDICSIMEDWAGFFQPIFLMIWTVMAFRIARGGNG